MALLIIRRPGVAEQQAVLPEGEVTIGRTEDNGIVIDDPRVSRRHANISPGPSGYRIQDLGSSNGTRVNGKKVGAEGHLLENGDQIALGGNQVLLSYFTDDSTITGTSTMTGTSTISRWGIPMPWQMQLTGSRWRFLAWLRMAGIILTVISASLGIIFWLTRILGN